MTVTDEKATVYRIQDRGKLFTVSLAPKTGCWDPDLIRIGHYSNGNDMSKLTLSREAADILLGILGDILYPIEEEPPKQDLPDKAIGAEEVSPGYPPAATEDINQLPHTEANTQITAVIYTGTVLTSNPPRYTADLKKNGQTIKKFSVAYEYPHTPLQEELEVACLSHGLTLPVQWMNLVSFDKS